MTRSTNDEAGSGIPASIAVPDAADRHLLAWIRAIRLEWNLELPQLARLVHADEATLARFLALSPAQAAELPTIPVGLDHAPALVSIYRRLRALYPRIEDQVKWLFTSHPDFGGEKPVEVAASSVANLLWVAYALESAAALAKRDED